MSVEFGIITSVIPPQGWHYPQSLSSGQSVRITGFSFEQLLDNILDFRRRHIDLCGAQNAYIESVRTDLKAYLCANFRQNCADSQAAPPTEVRMTNLDYQRPIDRAAGWLAELGNQRPEFVDYGLAGQRAEICVQCPMNIRWAVSCAPCNDNVLIRIQHVKGNLRTQLDSRLLMCRSHGWANEVAVWLKDPATAPLHPVPLHCWAITKET